MSELKRQTELAAVAINAALAAARREGAETAKDDIAQLKGDIEEVKRNALCAALPAEPPAALIEAMAQGMKRFDDWYSTSANTADGRDWYRSKKAHWVYDALRAHLLGEDA